MKKTTQIYMASTTFTCTEEAYEKLAQYLEELRTYFSDNENRDEVLADIEGRIAEKLLERKANPVTFEDVMVIIAEVGDVADLIGEDMTHEDESNQTGGKGLRKLYRDTDNRILAGVASGLGAYFNIDPLLFRVAFVVTIFFGGAGIFIYLLLWILIPTAETPSQKLEMRGQKITFSALEDTIRNSYRHTAKRGSGLLSGLVYSGNRVVQMAGKIFGSLLAFISFFTIIGGTILLGIVLINWNHPLNNLQITESSSFGLLVTTLIALYFTIIIPAFLALLLGLHMCLKRGALSMPVGLGLLGVWALSLVIAAVGTTTIAAEYHNYITTEPQFQEMTEVRELGNIHTIFIDGSRANLYHRSVTIESGDRYQVAVHGTPTAIESVLTAEADGVLTITNYRAHICDNCFFNFANYHEPSIVITVPSVDALELHNSVAHLNLNQTEPVTITADSGFLRGAIEASNVTFETESQRIDLSIEAATVTITKSKNSLYSLQGRAATAFLDLDEKTTVYAEKLELETVHLTARDSFLRIQEQVTLEAELDDDSTIERFSSSPYRRLVN